MKKTINPLKWLTHANMLREVEESVLFAYGEISSSNIESVSSIALDVLTRDAISKNLTSEEFAYVLYCMDEEYIAYHAVFPLESLYGKIPFYAREKLVDKVACIHYKLAKDILLTELEYAS